jgi:hypothetical protein
LIFVIAPETAQCSSGVDACPPLAMTNIKSQISNDKWNIYSFRDLLTVPLADPYIHLNRSKAKSSASIDRMLSYCGGVML